ncbi:methyl-accepting chemotaxis protein [Cohnella silvisoli]|uniref:Cache domain-containing protein n=1 Tax=Cohnella silvisoli TaxID=2873699 RepID=A0ABV1KNF5_9BACL|nr:cache domain-containing protein [Cohnella silvisoli]MCD9020342.1 cache domain-containing protein [Cohnella silvisoli]
MKSREVKKMSRLTIRRKLLIVSSLLLIVPILAFGAVTYKVTANESNALIENGLKNNVKMAGEMLNSLDKAVQNGTMTKEEAQEDLRVILLGEKQADNTRPINKKIDLGESGYFFVLDDKGNLLAHPKLEGQNIWDKQTSDGTYYIQDMIKAAQNGGGFTYYDWPLPDSSKEARKVAYAETFSSWGWVIAAGSYMKDYNGGQRDILVTMAITLGICLAVGITVLTLFALHISRPVIRISDQAERIAQGDLTGNDIVISNKDEIGRLADSFNRLSHNLRELAGNQLLSANALAASSSSLSNVIGETVRAAHQTSDSLSELAVNNETQAGSIVETSKAMEEMTGGIGRIAATAANTFEASAETLKEAEEGNGLIQRSSEQMASISSTVGDLSIVIKQLGDRSQQIGDIAEAISDISAQTNLLALNASIEAARAGEHGKGFAVVAGEIRKLAERSNESAAKVTDLIGTILGDIANAGESMQKGELEVAAGTASISLTGEAFVRILQATRSVVDQAEEASAAAEQMSASAEEIAASLQQMESVSSNSAGAASSISAVTEEQLASMEEISSSANKLSQMSDGMKQLASKFKIG